MKVLAALVGVMPASVSCFSIAPSLAPRQRPAAVEANAAATATAASLQVCSAGSVVSPVRTRRRGRQLMSMAEQQPESSSDAGNFGVEVEVEIKGGIQVKLNIGTAASLGVRHEAKREFCA